MSITVDRGFVHAYTREIHRISQQEPTKLRAAARVKTGVTGKTYNYERLGASDLASITARHQPTPLLNPEHSRRRATLSDRGGAILLDKHDEPKLLIEPENDYARNHAASINRYYDDLIIAALTGSATAVDETDATSSVTLASFASGTHVIANGGTGLTFAKVNQANRLLNVQDVPFGDRYFAISPVGLEDLLATTQATSADFVNLKALQSGRLEGPWMGFNWIVSTRLAITGNIRSCIAWHKNGVGLAVGIDMYASVSTRHDLNDATQVYAAASAGAVRIEEALVVQVDIDESA